MSGLHLSSVTLIACMEPLQREVSHTETRLDAINCVEVEPLETCAVKTDNASNIFS